MLIQATNSESILVGAREARRRPSPARTPRSPASLTLLHRCPCRKEARLCPLLVVGEPSSQSQKSVHITLGRTLLGPSLMCARPYHRDRRRISGQRLAITVCETPRYPEYTIAQRRIASLVSPSDEYGDD